MVGVEIGVDIIDINEMCVQGPVYSFPRRGLVIFWAFVKQNLKYPSFRWTT